MSFSFGRFAVLVPTRSSAREETQTLSFRSLRSTPIYSRHAQLAKGDGHVGEQRRGASGPEEVVAVIVFASHHGLVFLHVNRMDERTAKPCVCCTNISRND